MESANPDLKHPQAAFAEPLPYVYVGMTVDPPGRAPFVRRSAKRDEALEKLKIVTAVVESPDLGSVLLELPAKQVVVGRLTSKAVSVLCEHHGHTASGNQVPHVVHAGPLQTGAALPRVLYLFEDLVAFVGGVVSHGFDLLG
jgi:hypothetical protein